MRGEGELALMWYGDRSRKHKQGLQTFHRVSQEDQLMDLSVMEEEA